MLEKYVFLKFNEIQSESDFIELWQKGIGTGLTDFEVKTYLKKLSANIKK